MSQGDTRTNPGTRPLGKHPTKALSMPKASRIPALAAAAMSVARKQRVAMRARDGSRDGAGCQASRDAARREWQIARLMVAFPSQSVCWDARELLSRARCPGRGWWGHFTGIRRREERRESGSPRRRLMGAAASG